MQSVRIRDKKETEHIISHGTDPYLDACGSLPAVYAPEFDVITANPSLIPDIKQDPELLQSFPIEEKAFFPFGLTPNATS